MNLKRIKWLLNKITEYGYVSLFFYSIIFTGASYISLNTSSQIYDYPFHLARIIGLAQSLSNGDWLPNLNYLFLNGSGYGVPMFYGNWMFYIPALVFLITKIGTVAFASFVWLLTIATSYTTFYSIYQITHNRKRAFLGAVVTPAAVTFFGFGMTAAVPFIPLLIYALYKVLYQDKRNPILLAFIIALLVQTHIISTIVLAISSLIFVIFNITKLTIRKILSFVVSVIIAMFLSMGFILQYLEQNQSQIFFVNWKLRDFPFPTAALMTSESLIDIIKNYYFPAAIVFLLIAIICLRKLNTLSKQLLFLSIVLLICSSELLPWENVLKSSFLAVFQYTTRLIYFLPIFILMAICISAPKKISVMVAFTQIAVYVIFNPLAFLPNSSNYAQKYGLVDSNINVMRNQNSKAVNAFENPLTTTYDTSGDEYLNLSVNHEDVRNGTINQFYYDSDIVKITNVKQGYNNLEFDVKLMNSGETTVVLPRIWYKGYISSFSSGGSGSQPYIEYTNLTDEEMKQYEESGKPETSKKALYDGRAVITINSSGHVKIFYQKTTIQIIGFIIELFSFTIIFAYSIAYFVRHKEANYAQKTINRRPLLQ